LEKLNVTVARSYVGSFMTSLEMQGIMITLCEVDESRLGKHGRGRCRYLARCTTLIPVFFLFFLLQALLDAATQAPAWPKTETNNMTESCVGRKGGLKQCLVTVECVFQCLCSMFVFNVCVQCLCLNVCVQCLCSMFVFNACVQCLFQCLFQCMFKAC
jgi:hypothetical protein